LAGKRQTEVPPTKNREPSLAGAVTEQGIGLAKSVAVEPARIRSFAGTGARGGATLALVVALMFAAGCERGEYRPIPGDSIRSGWASHEQPSALSAAPDQKEFLRAAAEGSLFEIEASKLAIAHGSTTAVRRFAEATLRDRVAAETDLRQLADSVGVTLPSQLNDTLRTRLAILAQLDGRDFDRAYARNVGVMAQEEALTAFERAAKEDGARVQRFAASQLPSLRKHLAWARELAAELDRTSMA
jgi:putative membrane protein